MTLKRFLNRGARPRAEGPLFFVHVPKTAGTSFRRGAEQCFKPSSIVYDYGKDASETSAEVLEHLYRGEPDFWRFGQACRQRGAVMVCGHVNVARFLSVFGGAQTLSFVRDPLQRMASEYAYGVRRGEYRGSFRDFYMRPAFHNRLSKIFHGVDLEALGFVGLTERYAASLEMLNARYGIEIPLREDNRAGQGVGAAHAISAEDEAALRQHNASDIALHAHACALFEARYRLFQAGRPWAHARLVEASAKRVVGWAWWADGSEDPVEVEVWVNEQRVATRRAMDARPGLAHLSPPRGSYVGFHLPAKLAAGDRVQCRVAETGQCFPPAPHRIAEVPAALDGGGVSAPRTREP